MGVFKDEARKWWEDGYCPIPINPNTKAPLVDDWQQFSEMPMSEDMLSVYEKEHPKAMLGLVMGTQVREGWRIIAIDIDDEELLEETKNALGSVPSAKVGAKGITYFARMHVSLNAGTRRFKRLENGKKVNKPSIELLGIKSQTVIPPSIHPQTKKPYEWVGKSILDIEFDSLPIINDGTLKEIEGICAGRIGTILKLNTMTWLGVGGGGDTHEVCKDAVALMVRDGWQDDDIHTRVERAKKEACARNGDVYDWPEARKSIQEWIDSAKKKGFDKQGEEARAKMKKPNMENVMAEWLIKYLGGEDYVVNHLNQIRRYHEGHWPVESDDMIKRALAREFKEQKMHEIHASMSRLYAEQFRPDFGMISHVEVRNDPKAFRLCLKNGTVNLRTGHLERHRPEDELFHQLKFDWDAKAECPMYDKFINEMFLGDKGLIDCVHEFMGYSLIPDNSFQKFMVLIGPGGNGKGTLTRMWSSLFDQAAIASINVKDLNDQRMVTSLSGKLLNISSEQSRFDQLSDAMLKQITGNDPVTIRRLYKEADNNQRFFVRFVMQVNVMPQTSDGGDSLGRRVIIIPCDNKVLVPDPELDKKLIKERAGILRKYLIPAINRLYANNAFSEPVQSHVMKKDWLESNESVKYWLSECCNFAKSDAERKNWPNYTPSRELFSNYIEFCEHCKFKPFQIANEVQWGIKLTEYGLPSESKYVAAFKKNVKMRAISVRDDNAEF